MSAKLHGLLGCLAGLCVCPSMVATPLGFAGLLKIQAHFRDRRGLLPARNGCE